MDCMTISWWTELSRIKAKQQKIVVLSVSVILKSTIYMGKDIQYRSYFT